MLSNFNKRIYFIYIRGLKMQFKFIDSKNKEMYFTHSIVEDADERIRNNIDLIVQMDAFALQNRAFHNCFVC